MITKFWLKSGMSLYIYQGICHIEEKEKYLQVEGNVFNLIHKINSIFYSKNLDSFSIESGR